MPKMIQINGIIDNNDLAFITERYGAPLACHSAPLAKGNIHPGVSRFYYKDNKSVSVFHVKPVYYQHRNGQWRPLSEVCTHYGNIKFDFNEKWVDVDPNFFAWLARRTEEMNGKITVPLFIRNKIEKVAIREGREIFFTTDTFYPSPGTTVDGRIDVDNVATWTLARDPSSGAIVNDTEAEQYACMSFRNSDSSWYNYRGFFLFDTSSLPDADTISSANLSLWNFNINSNADSTSCIVISSNPASNSALALSDYSKIGTTDFGSINFSSITLGQYNPITLNSSGISNISKTGVSKFATITGRDFSNSAPTGNNSIYIYYSNQTGTTYDPKLVVEHSSTSIKTINGLATASVKTINGLAIASVKSWNGLT